MTTAHVEVTIDEYPAEFAARMAEIPKWLDAAMLDAAEFTRDAASDDSPVDTGFYKGSWEVRRIGGKSGIRVEVANDAPYAGIIELGTRPGHRTPIRVLIDWARRKAGDLHLAGALKIGPNAFRVTKAGYLRYKGQASLDPDDEDAVERFAWAVRAAIFKRGLRPRRVMMKQIPKARLYLEKVYEHLLSLNAGKKIAGGSK